MKFVKIWIFLCVALIACVGIATVWSLASQVGDESPIAWKEHYARNKTSDWNSYVRDRARVFSGFVVDGNEVGIAGAEVAVVNIEDSIVQVAKDRLSIFEPAVVEARVITDSNGYYEFSDLSLGIKSIYASQPGRFGSSAPFVVVQEGFGGKNDIQLDDRPDLRIELPESLSGKQIVVLGKHWSTIPAKLSEPVLERNGDSYSEGTVFVLENDKPIAYSTFDSVSKVISRNDFIFLESSQEHNWFDSFLSSGSWDQDALLGFESSRWGESDNRTPTSKFYSVMSPLACLISTKDTVRSEGALQNRRPTRSNLLGKGQLTGNTSIPYAPVLFENDSTRRSQVVFSSKASEFFSPLLPIGNYRVRTIGYDGLTSWSMGARVVEGQVTEIRFSRLETIRKFEVEGKGHVCGFVDADFSKTDSFSVVMQDTISFRKFLKTVKVDENGFFAFRDVPSDREYYIFVKSKRDIMQYQQSKTFVFSEGFEKWVSLPFFSNRITLIGSLSKTLRVRAFNKNAENNFIFDLSELNKKYQITNIPIGPTVIELVASGGVVSQTIEFDSSKSSDVTIQVNGGDVTIRE